MKTKIIKGIKYDMFERDDIINKLNRSEKDWELVDKYQTTFPELTKNSEGFCISTKELHKQLSVGRDFSTWIKGRMTKYNFIENEDFVVRSLIHQNGGIKNKGGDRKSVDYLVSIDMAKQLCMIENNELGNIVRKYFIIMEKSLRDYLVWINVREPEKKNWNYMIECLKVWSKNKIPDFDETNDLKFIRIREANMLNVCLTGMTASELQKYKDMKDDITRDHLDKDINSAMDSLQTINSSLLLGNLDFESRKQIIKTTCENKFKELYLKND